jgi:hypothetical protein
LLKEITTDSRQTQDEPQRTYYAKKGDDLMNARKYVTLALLIIVIAVTLFYLLHPGTEILWSRHLTISPAFAIVQPMALDEQSLYIAGGALASILYILHLIQSGVLKKGTFRMVR